MENILLLLAGPEQHFHFNENTKIRLRSHNKLYFLTHKPAEQSVFGCVRTCVKHLNVGNKISTK